MAKKPHIRSLSRFSGSHLMADPSLSSCPSYGAGPTQDAAFPGSPPPQLALLDMFFPGFSMFAGAFQRYFYVDLNLYIPLLLFLSMFIVCWNYASGYLWDQVETHFMSVVDIRIDDEIYNILMAWVATQRFSQGARKFVVNTSLSSRSWYLWRWNDDDDDDDDEHGYGEGSSNDRKKKKALSYTPSFGSHYFWYRGRLLLFRRLPNREQNSFMHVSEREEISISCFGRNPWILKELLLEAREKYLLKDEHKTQIYRGTTKAMSSEPSWQRCMSRASRPFSTVILNEERKKELIDDVTDYLNPMTQRWYANRGIPYRRGYLLHGPPGTGKSSLSLALAGFFKLRIYIVSLSSVNATEENLGNLFAELPRRCVVLLEDIDSAGLTHTRENDNKNPSPPPKEEEMEPGQITRGNGNTNDNNNTPSFRLSLSGLLNILDGVASQEGRILIMTTNHPEKLDKALIRPGRVDMVIGFGLADEYMIINIFRNIFAYLEGDDGPEVEKYIKLTPEEREVAMEKRKKERLVHDSKIEELAKIFASKIPAHEFSPAELQGHLMKNKHNPQNAIDTAEEFIEKTRAEHKEKERKAAEEKRKAEEKKKRKMKIKKRRKRRRRPRKKRRKREKVKAEMEKKKAEEEAKKSGEKKKNEKDKEATESNNEASSDAKPDVSPDPATKSATTACEKMSPVAPSVDRIIVREDKKSDDDEGSRHDSGYGTPLSETHEA
ncbi:hypothetical protein RRF57_001919 [Xylaria bambusicola]|uniref:Mitochondrial chaperone BCS1 n=1 Tax=Xylaria bambusicola TaxID=326684 RepID=A0AAN7UHY3_9PEZI